jgi:hypothetical protein
LKTFTDLANAVNPGSFAAGSAEADSSERIELAKTSPVAHPES